MKLDLSCPIELRGYSLTYTDSTAQADLRLYNLSSRRVASFEAVAKWHSRLCDRSVAVPFCAEHLRASGENGFHISLTCSRLPDADQLELVFTAVHFEDGCDDWRAGQGMIVDVSPIEAIAPGDLAALRSLAGEDAVCFPRQDCQTWRCVCGRINANADQGCARCHRDHAIAVGHTPENVRFLSEAIRPTQIGFNDDEAVTDLHRNYLCRRSKLFHRTLVMVIAALALTAMLVMKYQPVDAANASAESVVRQTTTVAEEE